METFKKNEKDQLEVSVTIPEKVEKNILNIKELKMQREQLAKRLERVEFLISKAEELDVLDN